MAKLFIPSYTVSVSKYLHQPIIPSHIHVDIDAVTMTDTTSFPRGRSTTTTETGSSKPGESSNINNASTINKKKRDKPAIENDILFGQKSHGTTTAEAKNSRKKRKTTTSNSESATSMLPLGGGGVVAPNQKQKEALIESISFQKLAKGTKLLGIVREINDKFALVSLPNLLTGYLIPKDSETYPLTVALTVGQTLAVYVVKTATETVGSGASQTSRKRIQLSIEPHHFNSGDLSLDAPCRGQVLSVEDHGILVSLGNDRKGFLKFDDIAGDYSLEGFDQLNEDDGEEKENLNKRFIHPGRVLDFVVKPEKSMTAIVPLILPSHTKMAKMVLPSTFHPPLSALNPGTLVNVKVESLARNGLCVSFLGGVFRGAIDWNHFGAHWRAHGRLPNMEWKTKVFDEIRNMPARIIAVDAKTKLVRLSLQSHILTMRGPTGLPAVGTVIQGATVIHVDPSVGALLALPEEYDTDQPKLLDPFAKNEEYREASKVRTAHVHISKAMDGGHRVTEAEFAKAFAPSTAHTLRILSNNNWMDGVATCATASLIVDAHVLTHSDLQVGKIYRAVPVCGQLDGGSIMVDFGMGVKGLIPSHHLFDKAGMTSDYRLKLRKEKFAIGNKIDVRVLELDASQRKCTLTAKKSLLKSKDSLTSYDNIQVGQQATGFISKIDDRAVFVTFYNRVYGRVTARSLAAELGVENIQENYNMGDVVTCRVISCRRRVGKNLRDYADDEDIQDFGHTKCPSYWDLNVSLNLNVDAPKPDQVGIVESCSPGQVILRAGAILPPKCMKVVEVVACCDKKRHGEFVPGHAIVRIKAKYILKNDNELSVLPYIDCKLPFDQLLDTYKKEDIDTKEGMDELSKRHLKVGMKLNCKGLVLTDPKRSSDEYSSGIGKLPIVSLRPKLIITAENQAKAGVERKDDPHALVLPSADTHLFMGAYVQGFVAQADPRHGSFVRFLDGLTGLVPKLKKGLELSKYETVSCRIVALDVTAHPMKILLKPAVTRKSAHEVNGATTVVIKPGDVVGDAEITDINFMRVSLKLLGEEYAIGKIRARLHVTMTDSESLPPPSATKKMKSKGEKKINKTHPFYQWTIGQKLSGLTCVGVDLQKGVTYVELASPRKVENDKDVVDYVASVSELHPGMATYAIVTAVPKSLRGLWVQVSPGITAFIPSLELTTDVNVLNDLSSYFPVGSKLRCRVMNKQAWQKNKKWGERMPKLLDDDDEDVKKSSVENIDIPFLSLLLSDNHSDIPLKPLRGELLIGRVNHSLRQQRAPALMLELRGGFTGRCCITELEEPDDWVNMPLGRIKKIFPNENAKIDTDEPNLSESGHVDLNVEGDDEETEERTMSDYPHGRYVQCRVLAGIPSQPMLEVSVRQSRLEGDLDDDELPDVKDTIHAYVVETNRKGCFVRLSRGVRGRVLLKDLSDGFLPDPAASFPMGRLVVGKVKEVHFPDMKGKKYNKPYATIDIDMRESVLLDNDSKLSFDYIELGSKHKATVTRLEAYGVFVRLNNSDVSGLVHKSECSDKYIKNLADLYDPGDLVKVLVVKKDQEGKKIGFSMKVSHFEGDEDSDDDASIHDMEMETGDSERLHHSDESGDDMDSDDENFMKKLAAKAGAVDEDGSTDENEADEASDVSDNDDTSDNDSVDHSIKKIAMDTDVGFEWGINQDKPKDDCSDDDGDNVGDEDDESAVVGNGHQSRKKAAARRRDEEVISRRETALADGTADENPETPADFERLLVRNPNTSEHWIRFMAFHLSLADLESARRTAQRAFDRIDFRQECEKLNVWTALLTMELKYGGSGAFQQTIDKACLNNNPKQVYLRACEMLEKEERTTEADNMFNKMCKKFRGKKTVWIAHLKYLLHGGRHQEAQALLKRALTSLPNYKHVETMSKFAQLEFELGSVERGRTIFDGLLEKYQKRMDLLFVYADKEVKAGEIAAARVLLHRTSLTNTKLSDKQMKALFKKWYRIEELHGNEETQENVKDAARSYVERSSK